MDGLFTFDGTELKMILNDNENSIKFGQNNKLFTQSNRNKYAIYVTKKSNINSIKSNNYIINISKTTI